VKGQREYESGRHVRCQLRGPCLPLSAAGLYPIAGDAKVRFRITDNLPDLNGRVYREEVRLLARIAHELLSGLTEERGEGTLGRTEEVRPRESRPIRQGVDGPPG